MANIDIVKKLKESTFTDEDGEDYTLEFQEGLTDDEIDTVYLVAKFHESND